MEPIIQTELFLHFLQPFCDRHFEYWNPDIEYTESETQKTEVILFSFKSEGFYGLSYCFGT